MKHTMTIFKTNPETTKWMHKLDLFHGEKYFVDIVEVTYETSTQINDAYFQNLIDKSLDSDDILERYNKSFIAAIEYEGNFYFSKYAHLLSDGKHEMFINQNWKQEKIK